MTAGEGAYLVVGLGVTGRAVLEALAAHDLAAVVVDDAPAPGAAEAVEALGATLVARPEPDELARLVGASAAVVPSPGVPDRHPVHDLAARGGVPVLSEFDLAARWDRRPLLAVTGTNGKTTVTTLITDMLERSGVRAAAVGNTEVPLVAAIGDAAVEVFVVEASSFRLARSSRFAPAVGTWLNFAPDHLDNHRDLAGYEAAKARIWADQTADQVAVGNLDDAVVRAHLARATAQRVTFSTSGPADHHLAGTTLVSDGDEVLDTAEMARSMPHDVANALAAIATARHGGARLDGIRAALAGFSGLPHRVRLVGEAGGVRYVDDSKATVPHATLAALAGFDSVVLIAGGRNKGLDLGALRAGADRIRAVVAIGEAAGEVAAAFDGLRPVQVAADMDAAVAAATAAARPGDAVLLSPGCASFDAYRDYAQRGDDFARAVRAQVGTGARP